MLILRCHVQVLFSLIHVLHLPFHIKFYSSACLQQVTELPFFATKVRLGRGGAEEIFPLGPLNEYERYSNSLSNYYLNFFIGSNEQRKKLKFRCLILNRIGLEKAKRELAGSIQKGVEFIKK